MKSGLISNENDEEKDSHQFGRSSITQAGGVQAFLLLGRGHRNAYVKWTNVYAIRTCLGQRQNKFIL